MKGKPGQSSVNRLLNNSSLNPLPPPDIIEVDSLRGKMFWTLDQSRGRKTRRRDYKPKKRGGRAALVPSPSLARPADSFLDLTLIGTSLIQGKCSSEITNQDGHCHGYALFPLSA